MSKLDVEDILGEIESWLVFDCIEENKSPEEDFYVEKFEHATMIADLESKFELNLEQLAHKYLLEILMEDCNKGYELRKIEGPIGDIFKVRVEKMIDPQAEGK